MLEKAEQLSFSRLNVLSACRMKYYYKYIERKEPLEPMPDYIYIGKTVDYALELAKLKKTESFDDYLTENKIEFLDKKWEWFCRGIWKNRRELYSRIFGESEVELQLPVDIYIVNKETGEIISDGDGRPIPFLGFLDGYVKTDNIIHEVKTTGASIDQTFIEHVFGGQTQIYTHAIIEKLKLTEIPHVIYSYIKKSRIKQKKDETIEEFYQRMFEAGKNPEIVPKEMDYTRAELDETMAYYFERISNDLEAIPTQDRNSCYKFGNKCEYYGYCWKHQHDFEEQEESAA